MKTQPGWLIWLIPARNQSFLHLFLAALVVCFVPFSVWDVFESGVFRTPADLPIFLLVRLIGAAVPAAWFASIEQIALSPARNDDDSKSASGKDPK